jgi:hypothetical protein
VSKSTRLLILGVLFLTSSAEAAPSVEDAMRAYLRLETAELFTAGKDARVRAHPALLAVIEHGADAIPVLIGALLVDDEQRAHLLRADAALIAIVSGQPPGLIRPLGCSWRSFRSGDQDRQEWLTWWREGCPTRPSIPGPPLPTAVTKANLRPWVKKTFTEAVLCPPDDWPDTRGDPEPTDKATTILHAALASRSMPGSEAMGRVAAYGTRGDRSGVLRLLARWGPGHGIDKALASLGRPEDAVFLARAVALQPKNRSRKASRHLVRLAAENEEIARSLLLSPSPIVSASGLSALVWVNSFDTSEMLPLLETCGSLERRAAYEEMEKVLFRWAPVLLERLGDPVADVASSVRQCLADGMIDAAVARPILDRLDASPHAFVRQRAAEALFGLSREDGARRLRREREVYLSGRRASGGIRRRETGFLGRVDALLGPPPGAHDSYRDAHMEPLTLCAEDFEFDAFRIPYLEWPTWSIRVRWAGDEPFQCYRDHSSSIRLRFEGDIPSLTGGGGGLISVGGPGPRRPAVHQPGAVICEAHLYGRLEPLDRFLGATMDIKLTLAGHRGGRLALDIPAERLDLRSDAEAFEAGVRSENADERLFFAGLMCPGGRGPWWPKPESLSLSERARVKDTLLDALIDEDSRMPTDPGARVFFPGTYEYRSRVGHGLVGSLRAFADDLLPVDVDRLVRLRDWQIMIAMTRWGATSVLETALRRGLGSDDAMVARNLSLLAPDTHLLSPETRQSLREAGSRWLGSADPLILQAGLHLASRLPENQRAANLGEAIDRAIRSADDAVRHTGAIAALKMLDDAAARIRDGYFAGDESARATFLECIDYARHQLGLKPSPELRQIFAHALGRGEEASASIRTLIGHEIVDTPLLVGAWETTKALWLRGELQDRGYHFGLPLLRRIQETPVLEALTHNWAGLPARLEFERLAAENPTPAHVLHAIALREALRTGTDARALCALLAVVEDEDSIDLLELACGSADISLRVAAALSLHVRAPDRADPFLRDLIERQDWWLAKVIDDHIPELRSGHPLRPLPPPFDPD